MNFIRSVILSSFSIPFFLFSCNKNPGKELLIITEVSGSIEESGFLGSYSWRLPIGSRIVSFDPGKPASTEILSEEFHSACFPEVSYNGTRILFAGKKNEYDPWQVFEIEIKSRKSRQITKTVTDCMDPVYLPSGRIAFTSPLKNDTVRSAFPIYTCSSDGNDVKQVTFGPSASFATSVLRDGRILTVNRQLHPELEIHSIMVMRPDGTKADLFYMGSDGNFPISRSRETADSRILFIEGKNYSDNELVSISYNRPLNSRNVLSGSAEGSFRSVLPLHDGRILVAYRKPDSSIFSLCEFDTETGTAGEQIYISEYNVLDIAEAVSYDRPKKLPSEVDLQVKTGLLLCQDINFTGFEPYGMPASGKYSRIEVMGIDSTYGIVNVEDDGSFYLKVMADIPFQIRRIDDKGNMVGDPCTWLWIRPNERRGCVGCHENQEIVPANRVAFAVRKAPVIIPVHLTEIKEKVVELE